MLKAISAGAAAVALFCALLSVQPASASAASASTWNPKTGRLGPVTHFRNPPAEYALTDGTRQGEQILKVPDGPRFHVYANPDVFWVWTGSRGVTFRNVGVGLSARKARRRLGARWKRSRLCGRRTLRYVGKTSGSGRYSSTYVFMSKSGRRVAFISIQGQTDIACPS